MHASPSSQPPVTWVTVVASVPTQASLTQVSSRVQASLSSQSRPSMEQLWDSLRAGHSSPPFCGGTVMVRVRDWVPPVHPPAGSVAQAPHSLQSLTWQSMGQGCSLQARFSINGSGQAAPSQDGGVVTVYVRDWVPPPHASVQVSQSLQDPAQSTG